jgi:transcriptional regulator with GAF, ATPase, and Fis domain/tetratricopeptide (TPR) repeat protein/predicted Ser/Thr protein kinase
MGLLDRYEVIRHLGRGGAGDVHLARDRMLFGRQVALKTIRARVDDVLRAAFEREFALLASLSVPGVAPVYDFGVMSAQAGQPARPFFTRAYIEGEPLDAAVGGLDLQARLRLFVRTTAVIIPLHRVGVVHGDLKPGNIIVDASGRAFLIDFGLSRAQGPQSAREHHGPVGTPAFMAPEMLRGEPSSVAADIYALGVMLFWLVSGELPYAELGARAMAARLEGAPLQLPAAGGVGRSALEIAQRALAGNAQDRFPCVDELHASVERLLTGPQRASVPAAARAFVVPRPRGHKDHLARLEAFVTGRGQKTVAGLVQAPAGGGKSLLLQELKWRLQLGSRLVLEIFAGRGSGALALIGLVEQLMTVLGTEHVEAEHGRELLRALRSGTLDEASAAKSLADLLKAVAAEASLVLLVDDLDRADAVLGSVLRSAIHAESASGVALIASATRSTAAAVRELQPSATFELPRLSSEDIAVLAAEALGPLDSSVVSALCDHVAGLPGALMSALYELSSLTAVTPGDVQNLPPEAATLALVQARLARLSKPERELLNVLALVSSLPESLIPAALGRTASESPDALGRAASEPPAVFARLEADGIVARDATNLMLSDRTLRKGILAALGGEGSKQLAARLLSEPGLAALGTPERAELSVIADDTATLCEIAIPAADALTQLGAHARAAQLLDALLAQADTSLRDQALLRLGQSRHLLGEHESAAALAGELAERENASPQLRAEACVVAARALTALSRWEDAIAALGRVPSDADGAKRARVQRELAKIHLRRGDYAAVSSAVEVGLACAPEDDSVRVELLCSQGMVAGYRGDQAGQRTCHEAALALARRLRERREEANALAYLAIGVQRSGDMASARDLFAQSLEIARELGDVGSMATNSLNLGVLQFYMGEHGAAAEHYASAVSLARRAGRVSTQIQARANLALLHVYFGLYEIARSEIDDVRKAAEAAGSRYFVAQTAATSAELHARTGQVEQALIGYDDAIARYSELGQTREVAEHNLDAAETLLDRNGPVDASAAAARLATARERIEREQMDDLRMRLDMLVARVRLANGEADAAAVGLDQVVTRARKAHARDVEWSALAALALAHEQVGSVFAARTSARQAVEVLEEVALRIPREHRDAFWQDARRRAVRERANRSEQHAANDPRTEHHTLMLDSNAERERLFQIIKRLASEHDLDRLLERIIESAVDLSAAERGSVMLVDAAGHLTPQFTRTRMTVQDEALASFSRSIAEAVLIDGEAIVTVDATADGRLSSYVSVHKLMLRSVACLPIRGHAGTVGVLYLEHRRSRGRFSDASVELLSAFADQAAIAIENARLLDEIRRQKGELEQANEELEQAKTDLEELLLTRTRQLEDVQRELARVSPRSAVQAQRYGMIAKSAVMHRIFDAMGRLAGNAVPVVIGGESGTGKELVARGIHDAGPRASQAFVALNCGSLPETLLESELFGHMKGAFSGADRDKRGVIATANGGTLFLDEVSEMPAKMQIDLLRVLEEKTVCRLGSEVEEPVDVRVLVATQRSLRELVEQGGFREDLYYRLGVVELWLPPLRERRDDIPLLCEHFLREFSEKEHVPRKHLTRTALARLVELPWPGNVRQLSHVLVQACVMSEGVAIDVGDLVTPDSAARTLAIQPQLAAASINTLDDHRNVEKQRILAALEACGWNRVRAAQTLGMPRRTFYRRLADYSIL